MILAIDQGTTGTTCLVVDHDLRTVGRGYSALRQHFPQPGWVEHDPEEIWSGVRAAAGAALADAGAAARELVAVGIANQRETTLLWERRTGRPLHRAIVWQDRRTAERCSRLPAQLLRERTGLVPDPYFSATKLEWLLARTELPPRELCFGTVDSWLSWRLTDGAVHATDPTNACRTLLFGLGSLDWDEELLELFRVERSLLPAVEPSSGVVGETRFLGPAVPVAALAGDQQASLFGHGCFSAGGAKATYGTGSFLLAHAGGDDGLPPAGLLKSVAATLPGARPGYVLEGSVLASGAAVQWLRDGLGVIADATESERLARSVPSTGGVTFVPALTGLGSPHWRPDVRGAITGISRGTTAAEIVRAALEAIAFQVADVVDALPRRPESLRADGGATANRFLMQLQADVLGLPVEVAAEAETTAVGAAALAGLAVGYWDGLDEVASRVPRGVRYEPSPDTGAIAGRRAEWRRAVESLLRS